MNPSSNAKTEDDATAVMLRDSARTFLSEHHSTRRLRALRDSPFGYERQVWQSMADLGWLAMRVPEASGGLGLPIGDVAALCAELGAALSPEPFIACGLMPGVILQGAPAGPLRDRLLEGLMQGKSVLAVAWQEQPDQLDPLAGQSALHGTPGAFILSGSKRFVSSLPGADGLIISARHHGELVLVHLPIDAKGMQLAEQRLVDDSRAADVHFTATPVPADAVLARGAQAETLLQRCCQEALVAVCALQAAIADRSLEMTVDYMKTRIQFGRPLASFQALQHRLVDLAIDCRRARASLSYAVRLLQDAGGHDSGENNADLNAALSAAKARCNATAVLVTRSCIQLHGGMGFTDEADIGLYLRTALRLAGWFGTAEVHAQRFMQAREPVTGTRTTSAVRADTVQPARSAQHERVVPTPRDGKWPDYDAMSDEDFRQVFRRWLAENCPPEYRNPADRLLGAPAVDWMRRLTNDGWRAPGWPVRHGGLGLSLRKHAIYHEELDRAGVSRWIDHGVWSLGEILMTYASAAQRDYYLPRILSCEHVWAQGYSEPNAGSDLASLRTRAVRDGDHWVINGQKIWTSGAAHATHIFVLVRTNPDAIKQRGISFILADIRTPGITVRPIRNIADELEFCEVFFDNARVPAENLVGEVDQGWTIAKGLLGMERLAISSSSLPRRALTAMRAVGIKRDLLADPLFRQRYGALLLDIENLECFYDETANKMMARQEVAADLSMLRIIAGELVQRVTEATLEFAAEYGAIGEVEVDGVHHNLKKLFMIARPATIYGGTAEIQRNILAKSFLRLPNPA